MIDFEEFPLVKMFTEKARAEERIRNLTKIIEIQFGKEGLVEVEEQIRAIQDEEKLFTLIEPALTSSSLEDFKRVLVEI